MSVGVALSHNTLADIPEVELSIISREDKTEASVSGPGYAYSDVPNLGLDTFKRSGEINRLYLGGKVLSPTVRAQLIRAYPKLTLIPNIIGNIALVLEALTVSERANLLADIYLNFSQGDRYDNGLQKPRERLVDIDDRNFCSHLSNLVPQSDSQGKALALANRFLEFKELQPAIFFLEGEGGRGKTHIALGMAKRYLQEGKKVYFLSGLNHRMPTSFDINKMKDADVIVVDDLNSCTGIETIIKEVLRDCHERSKRLIITSNVAPETIINQLYPPGGDYESIGFKDRFQNHLLHQEITTQESFRNEGLKAIQRFFALGET